MQLLTDFLLDHFNRAFCGSFDSWENLDIPMEITQSTQDAFGHYQCNSALKAAKKLAMPPRQIAQIVVDSLNRDPTVASRFHMDIAGPGFINIHFTPQFLSQQLTLMASEKKLGINPLNTPKRVIIDFSSPNVAKEMHVGHLRSTIIGDSLARLLEFLGYDVLRLNHIGDWGTSFGMLIAYIQEYVPQMAESHVAAHLSELVEWYKAAKQRFDADSAFKKRSQEAVVALQQGNLATRRIWQDICAISRAAYNEIYQLLDVQLIERGESYYNPALEGLVADLERQGLVTISEGAKCIFLDGFSIPLMIQKSDGGYNYDTTDMAAIRQRIDEEKGDWLIYVTDAGQAQHFQMIFKAAELAGYVDPHKVRLDHVPFGLVLGPDGKKFKTRSGNTERLIDLLRTAIDKAQNLVDERAIALEETAIDKSDVAHALGIGAVKYADLACNRLSDYSFSYEKMLRFDGNTATFIMYAYVRAVSIQRKIGAAVPHPTALEVSHPTEMALGVALLRFGEALRAMTEELMPHRLTDYLYGLAVQFHAFFRDCRVEGSSEEQSRLVLCHLTAQTLKLGLSILGVDTVERM